MPALPDLWGSASHHHDRTVVEGPPLAPCPRGSTPFGADDEYCILPAIVELRKKYHDPSIEFSPGTPSKVGCCSSPVYETQALGKLLKRPRVEGLPPLINPASGVPPLKSLSPSPSSTSALQKLWECPAEAQKAVIGEARVGDVTETSLDVVWAASSMGRAPAVLPAVSRRQHTGDHAGWGLPASYVEYLQCVDKLALEAFLRNTSQQWMWKASRAARHQMLGKEVHWDDTTGVTAVVVLACCVLMSKRCKQRQHRAQRRREQAPSETLEEHESPRGRQQSQWHSTYSNAVCDAVCGAVCGVVCGAVLNVAGAVTLSTRPSRRRRVELTRLEPKPTAQRHDTGVRSEGEKKRVTQPEEKERKAREEHIAVEGWEGCAAGEVQHPHVEGMMHLPQEGGKVQQQQEGKVQQEQQEGKEDATQREMGGVDEKNEEGEGSRHATGDSEGQSPQATSRGRVSICFDTLSQWGGSASVSSSKATMRRSSRSSVQGLRRGSTQYHSSRAGFSFRRKPRKRRRRESSSSSGSFDFSDAVRETAPDGVGMLVYTLGTYQKEDTAEAEEVDSLDDECEDERDDGHDEGHNERVAGQEGDSGEELWSEEVKGEERECVARAGYKVDGTAGARNGGKHQHSVSWEMPPDDRLERAEAAAREERAKGLRYFRRASGASPLARQLREHSRKLGLARQKTEQDQAESSSPRNSCSPRGVEGDSEDVGSPHISRGSGVRSPRTHKTVRHRKGTVKRETSVDRDSSNVKGTSQPDFSEARGRKTNRNSRAQSGPGKQQGGGSPGKQSKEGGEKVSTRVSTRSSVEQRRVDQKGHADEPNTSPVRRSWPKTRETKNAAWRRTTANAVMSRSQSPTTPKKLTSPRSSSRSARTPTSISEAEEGAREASAELESPFDVPEPPGWEHVKNPLYRSWAGAREQGRRHAVVVAVETYQSQERLWQASHNAKWTERALVKAGFTVDLLCTDGPPYHPWLLASRGNILHILWEVLRRQRAGDDLLLVWHGRGEKTDEVRGLVLYTCDASSKTPPIPVSEISKMASRTPGSVHLYLDIQSSPPLAVCGARFGLDCGPHKMSTISDAAVRLVAGSSSGLLTMVLVKALTKGIKRHPKVTARCLAEYTAHRLGKPWFGQRLLSRRLQSDSTPQGALRRGFELAYDSPTDDEALFISRPPENHTPCSVWFTMQVRLTDPQYNDIAALRKAVGEALDRVKQERNRRFKESMLSLPVRKATTTSPTDRSQAMAKVRRLMPAYHKFNMATRLYIVSSEGIIENRVLAKIRRASHQPADRRQLVVRCTSSDYHILMKYRLLGAFSHIFTVETVHLTDEAHEAANLIQAKWKGLTVYRRIRMEKELMQEWKTSREQVMVQERNGWVVTCELLLENEVVILQCHEGRQRDEVRRWEADHFQSIYTRMRTDWRRLEEHFRRCIIADEALEMLCAVESLWRDSVAREEHVVRTFMGLEVKLIRGEAQSRYHIMSDEYVRRLRMRNASRLACPQAPVHAETPVKVMPPFACTERAEEPVLQRHEEANPSTVRNVFYTSNIRRLSQALTTLYLINIRTDPCPLEEQNPLIDRLKHIIKTKAKRRCVTPPFTRLGRERFPDRRSSTPPGTRRISPVSSPRIMKGSPRRVEYVA
eukprot:Sspe_Gene.24772::Locus_9858_Transcript_1_1_Confidence_1.000_Length_5057::g.24772::m.24772